MRIREATIEDRTAWNTFVDTEGGDFIHYYDWKYVYENRGYKFIPLLAENDKSELVGIFPIIREKRFLSSILHSDKRTGGLLLKRDPSDVERGQIIEDFVQYVDAHHSGGCSRFTLREKLPPAQEMSEEPTTALIDNGFHFRYDKKTHLPCTFIMEMKKPFEDNIWKGLWSWKLRWELNRVKRRGVVAINDQELDYFDVFLDMSIANYRRHGSTPPAKDEMRETVNVFRDNVKLFVALLDNRPIVTLLCYYSVSTCYLVSIGSYVKKNRDVDKLCFATAIQDACNGGYSKVDFLRTTTPGLALFKERFKGTRIPFRSYEKRLQSITSSYFRR